jgi:type III secretory pathway component EscV
LPIPAVFLDFMLVANILLALILLISTLYVSDPIKLSALPSLLLLATMYRLALNVSTTRRILSGVDPGQMIDAFGAVVVQGNIIVGLVVFLVITLVQFIVIAKGSERVAEVAARFTLDAMPGKQMSIDADMRAGLLTIDEARRKRDELQLESRFYGALDGSMKFVKGDAIAGIIITAINLVGGIVMGVAVFNLELTSCISRFSLYTIGDGLLSQIPALLNSLAAGMIVTRVTGTAQQTSLANELLQQIGQVRAVKVLIASLAILLSFVPGMPPFPFWILAVVLIVSSFSSANTEENRPVLQPRVTVRVPHLLELQLKPEAVEAIGDLSALTVAIDSWRQEVFSSYGLAMPPVAVTIKNDLKHTFNILVRGVTDVSELEPEVDFDLQYLTRVLERLCAKRAPDFVDDVMTRRLLDHYEDIAPEQIAYVVPDLAPVTVITMVLRELVREGVSIRSFDIILQAIAEAAKRSSTEDELLVAVRQALKRQICDQCDLYSGEAEVHQLDTTLDDALRQMKLGAQPVSAESISALTAELRQLSGRSTIVSSAPVRGIVRDLVLAHGLPHSCLADTELTIDARWRVATVLGVGNHHAQQRKLKTEQVW